MPETQGKSAAVRKSSSLTADRDKAAKQVADAQQATADAHEAQHDAKVALQNARFAELGESMAVDSALKDLGVTVRK